MLLEAELGYGLRAFVSACSCMPDSEHQPNQTICLEARAKAETSPFNMGKDGTSFTFLSFWYLKQALQECLRHGCCGRLLLNQISACSLGSGSRSLQDPSSGSGQEVARRLINEGSRPSSSSVQFGLEHGLSCTAKGRASTDDELGLPVAWTHRLVSGPGPFIRPGVTQAWLAAAIASLEGGHLAAG